MDFLVVGSCREFTDGIQACRCQRLTMMRAGPPIGMFRATTFAYGRSKPAQPRLGRPRTYLAVIGRQLTAASAMLTPVSRVNDLRFGYRDMSTSIWGWAKSSRCPGMKTTNCRFVGRFSTSQIPSDWGPSTQVARVLESQAIRLADQLVALGQHVSPKAFNRELALQLTRRQTGVTSPLFKERRELCK